MFGIPDWYDKYTAVCENALACVKCDAIQYYLILMIHFLTLTMLPHKKQNSYLGCTMVYG